nr:hypothetical protein PsAHV6-030 [Psittacid alphaherpesvirus 6]
MFPETGVVLLPLHRLTIRHSHVHIQAWMGGNGYIPRIRKTPVTYLRATVHGEVQINSSKYHVI